jgi:hypothetical protein
MMGRSLRGRPLSGRVRGQHVQRPHRPPRRPGDPPDFLPPGEDLLQWDADAGPAPYLAWDDDAAVETFITWDT